MANGGDWEAALGAGFIAGIPSFAFSQIGTGYTAGTLNLGQAVVAAGAVGGITAKLQGGKFGHGFVSAGVGFAVGVVGESYAWPVSGRIVAATVVGGTVSRMTGGKFANGAAFAAFTAIVQSGVAAATNNNGYGNQTPQQTNPTSSQAQLSGMSKVLSVVGDVVRKIRALPNTIIGAVYGGIGMLFGATPVWDSAAGILRFTNMPEWMMPTAMSFGHVQVFGPGAYKNPDGSFALNRFGVPIATEETLHTRQAEILGPLYLPLHGIGMVTSLISGGGTHSNNLLEMGPERGRSPWPWNK